MIVKIKIFAWKIPVQTAEKTRSARQINSEWKVGKQAGTTFELFRCCIYGDQSASLISLFTIDKRIDNIFLETKYALFGYQVSLFIESIVVSKDDRPAEQIQKKKVCIIPQIRFFFLLAELQ